MNKKPKILFFCMIIVGGAAHSQVKMKTDANVLPVVKLTNSLLKLSGNKINTAGINAPRPFIAADFYSKQLGFICRQEIKMDKLTRIPFRFRLGSVEQCNWLEGKRR